MFAAGLTSPLVGALEHGVTLNSLALRTELDPTAVALTIGWSGNFLWPKLLRRLGAIADAIPTATKGGS